MNAPITETANFVQVATMTVSYSIQGGGSPSPSAPVLNYVQAGVSKIYKLTSTATSIQVDLGSLWSVSPDPLSGSSGTQSWEAVSATLSGTVSSSTTLVFTFYHQYQLKLSYSVTGGGSVYTPPNFLANQYGVSAPQTLSTSATTYWFDAGSSWTVSPNPLTGSSPTEQWFTTQKTSGTLTGSATYSFKYQHRFYLTLQPSPSGTGTVSPSNNWFNAAQKVTIKATAKTGYKLLTWTGVGAGSYSGTSSSTTVTMNAPITETANFGVIITITSNPTGSGYVTVNGSPVKTSQTFVWVIGSTQTIAAVSPVGCGTGCQYVFTVWSDGGARSHTITVPSSPTTYKATFQKQYLLTMNVIGPGSVLPSSGWNNAGVKVTLAATANAGHTFKSWKGSGSGSYSGTNTSPTITMNSAINETATFT
jgi:hypothetical protein